MRPSLMTRVQTLEPTSRSGLTTASCLLVSEICCYMSYYTTIHTHTHTHTRTRTHMHTHTHTHTHTPTHTHTLDVPFISVCISFPLELTTLCRLHKQHFSPTARLPSFYLLLLQYKVLGLCCRPSFLSHR
jgi:ABC-type nickel/cobalt efflux system permease component RcnA